MEWKIGEIKQVNGEWYQCIKQPEDFIGEVCKNCAFRGTENCDIDECSYSFRSDKQDVIFKKLEKVGEPIIYMSRTFQRLKSSDAEQCKYCYFGNQVCNPQLCGKESFLVEIKQNKEDMEKYKMHDAKEDIPEFDKVVDECLFGKERPNLKPFNLEQAKAGKTVCTRDGRKARILCYDLKGAEYFIVAAIETHDCLAESISAYDKNGRFDHDKENNNDLMMIPEKKEGWINLYWEDGMIEDCTCIPYATREDALDNISDPRFVTTVKIEWEE